MKIKDHPDYARFFKMKRLVSRKPSLSYLLSLTLIGSKSTSNCYGNENKRTRS